MWRKRRTTLFEARRSRGTRLILVAVLATLVGFALLGPHPWSLIRAARSVRSSSHIDRVEGHAEIIRIAAAESEVDPNLIAALMLSESGGKVDAISKADCLGLLQLALPTAEERARVLDLPRPTRTDLLSDALLNVRLGANYLKWLERYYDGNLEMMLIAYNAGPGRLSRWIREAGGYDAWRAERAAAGNSDVLRYADKVRHYRNVFLERGNVTPPDESI